MKKSDKKVYYIVSQHKIEFLIEKLFRNIGIEPSQDLYRGISEVIIDALDGLSSDTHILSLNSISDLVYRRKLTYEKKELSQEEKYDLLNILSDLQLEIYSTNCFKELATNRHSFRSRHHETKSISKLKNFVRRLDMKTLNSQKYYRFLKDFDTSQDILNIKPLSNFNYLFHGTSTSEDRNINDERQYVQSYIKEALINEGCIAHIYDGPTITGRRFNRMVREAFDQFYNDTFSAINYNSNNRVTITLSGHSRGACAAIATYNCITAFLTNDTKALNNYGKYIESTLKKRASTSFNNLRYTVNDRKKHFIKRFKIRLILLDPVKGPTNTYGGYRMVKQILTRDIETDLIIYRGDKTKMVGFDMLLPDIVGRNITNKVIKLQNINHGHIAKFPSKRRNTGAHPNFVKGLLGDFGINYDHVDFFIKDQSASYQTCRSKVYYGQKTRKRASIYKREQEKSDFV